MSQVTEQSVRFQTALASIKLIQASAVLDLTEDDFDFLTSNKVWIATDRSRARRCVEACVYGTLDFVGYPRFPAPVEFIAAVIAYYVHPVNIRSEERFSRNAETDFVCRLLLEKINIRKILMHLPLRVVHVFHLLTLCLLMLRRPLSSILFPYTTLFRSIATDRSRARRCVEACVYGTLDFVGYPRFPAPVEFIAAVIAYYVHPVNI